jgi:pyruvate formate lyase activating enzyme
MSTQLNVLPQPVEPGTGNAGPIKGMVVNIQNFCTQDGPGIRTTVFLKACSLRCKWCSNPETIHPKPELAYKREKCIGAKECGLCLKPPCPEGAMYVVEGPDDRVHINWDLVGHSGAECASVCPTNALYMFGQEMTVDEVLEQVEKDAPFFAESGGGITVSGGECQLQPDFVAALLSEAHNRGINTAIETASNVPFRFCEKVLPHVDFVYHDIKFIDPVRHKKWTGVDNKRILDNLKNAYDKWPEKTFIARTPLIPGVNDSEDDIRAVLAFIRPHKNVIKYELLPYHRFGQSKYEFLGRNYELADFQTAPSEVVAKLRAVVDEAFGRKGWSEVKNPLLPPDQDPK